MRRPFNKNDYDKHNDRSVAALKTYLMKQGHGLFPVVDEFHVDLRTGKKVNDKMQYYWHEVQVRNNWTAESGFDFDDIRFMAKKKRYQTLATQHIDQPVLLFWTFRNDLEEVIITKGEDVYAAEEWWHKLPNHDQKEKICAVDMSKCWRRKL